MNMLEVNGTNMVENHGYPTNHLEEDDMNMVEEHYHLTNHRLEVEDINMLGIHIVEVGV
jgi:hypothetical protein